MHLMHAFVAHPCMRFLCYSEEPAKQTDSKGVASAQGRGIKLLFMCLLIYM